MKIALHGKSFTEQITPQVSAIIRKLEDKGCKIIITASFIEVLRQCEICPDDFVQLDDSELQDVDIFFSFGGDGTLLDAVTYVGPLEIPILGINTGRLGFLANTAIDEIDDALSCIFSGTYEVESRMLIHAESSEQTFDSTNFALNEFAILKQDTSSMITVHTYMDDNYLNSYWADGLIIASPTGSTGYSLSCGGPVVYPYSHSFIITPVSPHNLNVRPIIISDKSVISLKVESRSDFYLVSMDSRSQIVGTEVQFTIRKEQFEAKLIKTGSHTFIDTLRKKLNWGLDLRN